MTNIRVIEQYQTKKARINEINQDLEGKQICVLRGTSNVTVQELQNIIVSFGGIHVANPGIYCFSVAVFLTCFYLWHF